MARPAPLSDADYRALALFRRQLRQFLSFSEDAARGAGLQPRHHQALLAIRGDGPLTVGDLGERLGIKAHSAVELVNRLVTARLVRRLPDTQDRRRVYLVLTPGALRRLESLSIAHHRELQRLALLWHPLFRALGRDGKNQKSGGRKAP